MTSYGQFCPVSKAMELLDERWTLLVVRELLMGSRHFNELRRGVPRMSPALLSTRLRTLVRAGLVTRDDTGSRVEYRLTPAGQELLPVVEAVGTWGVRWVPQLGDVDLDPHLLVWDMHRNVDTEAALHAAEQGRTVVQLRFDDVPGAAGRWWLVITREGVDVCEQDPGHPVTATVRSDLRTLTQVWRGDLPWAGAVRAGRLEVAAPAGVRRQVQSWFALSAFAAVPRP